ncbi:tetratricopeptide repeat protein [Flavobacterium sp. CGRL2]
MNDFKSYHAISQLVLDRSISSKDSASIAKAYIYLGDYYGSKVISDSAFRNYFLAQKIYLQINDQYNLAKTLLSKASLQYNESDFFESEISVFKALSILKNQKNVNDQLYECYNLLGILYNEREEYEKALEYQNKALNTLNDKSIPADLQLKATSLNNIGFVYMRMKNYKQAIIYFEKGLKEKKSFRRKNYFVRHAA